MGINEILLITMPLWILIAYWYDSLSIPVGFIGFFSQKQFIEFISKII